MKPRSPNPMPLNNAHVQQHSNDFNELRRPVSKLPPLETKSQAFDMVAQQPQHQEVPQFNQQQQVVQQNRQTAYSQSQP